MPYPIEVMQRLHDAKTLIQHGEFAEAAHVADNIWAWAESAWDALNDTESMNFLGYFASVLKYLKQRERQIKLLERLCGIAERDLNGLGVMATDEDVRQTGGDFLELGLAYQSAGQTDAARVALEKARYILEELGWLVEVEKILAGEATKIGPSPLVKKRPWSPNSQAPPPSDAAGDRKELRELTPVATQLAKVLLMDSATERRAVPPWDPTSKQVKGDEPRDLLTEVLRVHAEDCKMLDADIPLVIGVPARYLEKTKAHLDALRFGGLRRSTVYLIVEPDDPAFDLQGGFAERDKLGRATFMAGGGVALQHALEDGTLGRLWKDGVRWLLCTQLANPRSIAASSVLPQLSESTHDTYAEVVDRNDLPDSIILPFNVQGRKMCLDARLLSQETLAKVGAIQLSCTGTFWLRADKLAGVFGITIEQLEAPWKPTDKKTRIALPPHTEFIFVPCNGMVAAVIPLWEVTRHLDMEWVRCGWTGRVGKAASV